MTHPARILSRLRLPPRRRPRGLHLELPPVRVEVAGAGEGRKEYER
jgi:hypothetical protein